MKHIFIYFPPRFFMSFSRIAIYLLLDDTKMTAVRKQCDWMAEKNWTGYVYVFIEIAFSVTNLEKEDFNNEKNWHFCSYILHREISIYRQIWFINSVETRSNE